MDENEAWIEKYGWAPRFGDGENFDHEGSYLDHQTWVEAKLDDRFYGGKSCLGALKCIC